MIAHLVALLAAAAAIGLGLPLLISTAQVLFTKLAG